MIFLPWQELIGILNKKSKIVTFSGRGDEVKRLLGICALLCCALLLETPARAAPVFQDDFGSAAEAVRTLDSNLAVFLRSAALESADRYQLGVAPTGGGRLQGAARYQATGAETLTLRLYSPKGTYVTADALGQPQLGSDSGVFSPDLAGLSPAYCDPDGNLYAQLDQWYLLAQSPQGSYGEFLPAPAPDPRTLAAYGVSVYATGTAGRQKLPLARTGLRHMDVEGVFLCAEDFTCAIPKGATQIWVELSDSGSPLISRSGERAGLAWVTLSGAGLLMGPQPQGQPDSPESPSAPPEEESSSRRSSSQSASQSAAQSPPPAAGGTAGGTSSKGAASSKFEGVITSSSPGGKSSAGGQKSQSAAPPPGAAASSSQAAPVEGQEEPLIYAVATAPRSSGPDGGMILYILLVSAVILYLLLRPKKKE